MPERLFFSFDLNLTPYPATSANAGDYDRWCKGTILRLSEHSRRLANGRETDTGLTLNQLLSDQWIADSVPMS